MQNCSSQYISSSSLTSFPKSKFQSSFLQASILDKNSIFLGERFGLCASKLSHDEGWNLRKTTNPYNFCDRICCSFGGKLLPDDSFVQKRGRAITCNLSLSSSSFTDTSLRIFRNGVPSTFGAYFLKLDNLGSHRPNLQRCYGWRKKDTKNVLGRAKRLVSVFRDISDTKEEIYRALDAWCAWELEFPMLALKKGLQLLSEQKEWKRVIQVCKWMLSKGQGKTLGTFTLMLQAYNETGRIEEMEELWVQILEENLESVPRTLFNRMMKIYEDRKLPLKVLEVFGNMDAVSIKPDEVILERVARAFIAVGAPNKVEELRETYPLLKTEVRYVNGVRQKVRVAHVRRSTRPGQARGREDIEGVSTRGVREEGMKSYESEQSTSHEDHCEDFSEDHLHVSNGSIHETENKTSGIEPGQWYDLDRHEDVRKSTNQHWHEIAKASKEALTLESKS